MIDDIRVDFDSGLTIITGETGAGKSILLGALALLLGKRADLSSAKDPSRKCIIEAEFEIEEHGLEGIFEANDMDYDRHTIVRREILPGGKSRAFVNDSPVTVAQLQALGIHLVDIHSQHETLVLSSEAFQMEVIDALADNVRLLEEYKGLRNEYKAVEAEFSELQSGKEAASRELDYNTFLFNELKEAHLDGTHQQELEASYETLNNSEEIQASLSHVLSLFSAEQTGTLETAREARNLLGKLRGFSSEFETLWERLNSALIEMEDLAESVEQSLEMSEADPKRLQEVNDRLQTLYRLQQKHKVDTVAALLSIQNELETKVESTLNMDDRIQKTEEHLSELGKKTSEVAEKLHERRAAVIPKLKEKLEEYLFDLGLPNARFNFILHSSETFRTLGMDTLELMFTANKGTAFGPLKKVASGGELSRIMLAVKAVLTQYKKLPTLIFDEIDTGVSGEIGHKIAAIMGEMSAEMQLFSITHLPQIAAKGAHHIKVYKEDESDVTVTRLKRLNEDERIVEIAQMIGGSELTDSALAHARELLN